MTTELIRLCQQVHHVGVWRVTILVLQIKWVEVVNTPIRDNYQEPIIAFQILLVSV